MTNCNGAGEDPAVMRVWLSEQVMVAAKLAAVSHDKSLCHLVKDILVDHLVERKYLTRPNTDC